MSRAILVAALLWSSAAGAWPVYADSADDGSSMREATPRGDGYFHVDAPRLIARLVALHATTFAFLLWTSPSDWDDLTLEFLPAAAQAKIEVWAYLVPPTEVKNKSIPPCGVDYVCWGNQIGMQAQSHPNLTGIVIDDFNYNTNLFTTDYMAEVAQAARSYSPTIEILPVAYYPGNLYYLMDDYTASIAGTVFPYIDLSSTGDLSHQLEVSCSLLKKPTLVMYLAAPEFDTTHAGDQLSLDTTVDALPGPKVVRFRVWDPDAGYTGTGPPGYRFAQLAVNGEVVWERDMAAPFKNGWDEWSVDVTAQVAGGATAQVSFRLFDRTDGAGSLDDTRIILDEGSGLDLTGADWTVSRVNASQSTAQTALRDYHGRCVLLIYAGGVSWHPANPTLDYLGQALDIGHGAILAGEADGLITYLLDKTPASQTFDPVAQRYLAWTTDGGAEFAPPDAAGTPPFGTFDASIVSPPPGVASCDCAVGRRSPRGRGTMAALLLALAVAAIRRRRREIGYPRPDDR